MGLFSNSNPNQDAIDKAYQEGVEAAKTDGILFASARAAATVLAPDSLKSDENRAFERGYDDASRGKA